MEFSICASKREIALIIIEVLLRNCFNFAFEYKIYMKNVYNWRIIDSIHYVITVNNNNNAYNTSFYTWER